MPTESDPVDRVQVIEGSADLEAAFAARYQAWTIGQLDDRWNELYALCREQSAALLEARFDRGETELLCGTWSDPLGGFAMQSSAAEGPANASRGFIDGDQVTYEVAVLPFDEYPAYYALERERDWVERRWALLRARRDIAQLAR
ncbi:hypothetical protein [Engelhardtia mirabilis]|uniref:hypothetical protein n=1 Tax=Engelhardtia mirabilis TaxID=2528011 RepID=UPI003AF3B4AA